MVFDGSRARHTVDVTVAAKGGGSRTSPSSPCSTRPTTSSTGCSRPSRPWAPAGARRACWASASAARREGHAAGQGSLMDDIDMLNWPRAARATSWSRTAHRALREGQRAGHRRAGPRRPDHRARREDRTYPTHAASLPVAMIPTAPPPATRTSTSTARPGKLEPPAQTGPDVTGRPTTTRAAALNSRHPRPPKSPAGSRARPCCSTARCSPAATPRTSASRTCWPRASRCP